ncbi:cytochrome c3 family protein [bacterium]|nr:cytochrome c3 family protein [bacterium]
MNRFKLWIAAAFAVAVVVPTLAEPDMIVPDVDREQLGTHVALGWNDLGMHCMNSDFSVMTVLPPYNNIWVQVIERGPIPTLVESGVTLTYRFPENTTSSNKVNFWNYAQALFGTTPATDVGLTGKGLTGELDWNGTAFEAAGIPLTPWSDADLANEQPYQWAEVSVTTEPDGTLVDKTTFVAPVSTEMRCNKCHGGSTEAQTARNILEEHDEEEGTNLMGSQPVLCASCHASNALGTPGIGIKNLSRAVHGLHAKEEGNMNCYDCHPGQNTQCQRGAMSIAGIGCTDCHGTLTEMRTALNNGRQPWLEEPRCQTCHEDHGEEAGTLYRQSTGHGGVYCAACHNSPHALMPTTQSRDWVQSMRVQGTATYIKDCLVCHTEQPMAPGPHGVITSYLMVRMLDKESLLTPVQFPAAEVTEDSAFDVADVIHQVGRGL